MSYSVLFGICVVAIMLIGYLYSTAKISRHHTREFDQRVIDSLVTLVKFYGDTYNNIANEIRDRYGVNELHPVEARMSEVCEECDVIAITDGNGVTTIFLEAFDCKSEVRRNYQTQQWVDEQMKEVAARVRLVGRAIEERKAMFDRNSQVVDRKVVTVTEK